MKLIKTKLVIFLTIAMMMSLIFASVPSLAGVNIDSGDAGGDTGKGSNEWAFSLIGRGIRIGIYFVEGGEANFAHGLRPEGNEEPDDPEKPYVRRVGLPMDFSKEVIEDIQKKYGTTYDYTVEGYSEMSVFDYMNKEGRPYKLKDASVEPYEYIKPTLDIITSMPEPFQCSKEDWVEWFTGDDYKNIPEISKLCGQEISKENFKEGIYIDPVDNIEKHGTYKIFFEPLISARVNGVGMFLSLRDAIRYNEYHTSNTSGYYNGKIVDWLNLMFEYLANKAFLAEDEIEALNMLKNDGYRVEYLSETDQHKKNSKKEIIDQMKPNGKVYKSMGVGVVTPNPPTEPPPEPVVIPEELPDEEVILNTDPEEVKGQFKAEDRDAEKYDVSKGIPCAEELYANITAPEYLKDFDVKKVEGSKDYDITVRKTFRLHYETWDEDAHDCPDCSGGKIKDPNDPTKETDCSNCGGDGYLGDYVGTYTDEEYENTYTITRNYRYWMIDKLAIYEIENAQIESDVLEGGKSTINVNGSEYKQPLINEYYHDTSLSYHVTNDPLEDAIASGRITRDGTDNVLTVSGIGHIYPGEGESTTTAPSIGIQSFTTELRSAVGDFKVRNDTLVFNNSVIMSGAIDNDGDAQKPIDIPSSPEINRNVLYKEDLAVERDTLNGTYDTKCEVRYRLLSNNLNPPRGNDVILEQELNPVTVHTPVACNSGVRNYNSQQIGAKESKRSDIILGEKAELLFEANNVMHRDITGYGTKDYTKYVEYKYVRFPFDVYIESAPNNYVYVKANTWHLVSKPQERLFIKVPVWVNEGDYIVNFKTIAINAPDDIDEPSDLGFSKKPSDMGSLQQRMVNTDINNYVAYRDSNVRVVGQVRNFKITDINDYPLWEKVFRQRAGSSLHTGKDYAVGNALGENPDPYTLPIMEGSIPTQRDRGALKTGYAFKFTLETVGEYFEDNDYIRIKPTFYYVNKDGSGRRPVDIYYNEYFNGKDNILVKIGSDKDKLNKHMITNTDIYRNMPEADIQRTCELLGITDKKFKGKKVDIGTYDEIVLSKDLRLFTGNTVSHPFAGGSAEAKRVLKSVQRWYGEYKLPDKLYVTAMPQSQMINHPEFQDGIDGRESFWLKDGYIIVNFSIETHQDDSTKSFVNPKLGYWNARYTQEGSTYKGFNMWNAEGFVYTQKDYYKKDFNLLDGDVVFYHAGKKSSDDYKIGGNR